MRLPKTIRDDLSDVSPPARYLATKPWTSGTHETVVKHDAWRNAVHAYLATVSFVDAIVGEVVAGLDSGPHADNTWKLRWISGVVRQFSKQRTLSELKCRIGTSDALHTFHAWTTNEMQVLLRRHRARVGHDGRYRVGDVLGQLDASGGDRLSN